VFFWGAQHPGVLLVDTKTLMNPAAQNTAGEGLERSSSNSIGTGSAQRGEFGLEPPSPLFFFVVWRSVSALPKKSGEMMATLLTDDQRIRSASTPRTQRSRGPPAQHPSGLREQAKRSAVRDAQPRRWWWYRRHHGRRWWLGQPHDDGSRRRRRPRRRRHHHHRHRRHDAAFGTRAGRTAACRGRRSVGHEQRGKGRWGVYVNVISRREAGDLRKSRGDGVANEP
jgi:hypothetical protein